MHIYFLVIYFIVQTVACILGFYVIVLGACVRVCVYASYLIPSLGQWTLWWSSIATKYLRFIFLPR